jgi:hypothetical protein
LVEKCSIEVYAIDNNFLQIDQKNKKKKALRGMFLDPYATIKKYVRDGYYDLIKSE